MHCSRNILLIRPASFGYNTQTAGSNVFQNVPNEKHPSEHAAEEFDIFAATLKKNGINVFVFEDTKEPVKPDAVFPNNWVSFHPDGTIIFYPMFAPNRRIEKREDIVEALSKKFIVRKIVDLTPNAEKGKFLEGTGSIVFDHINRVAFACLSPRTDEGLFKEVCEMLGYKPVAFYAHDRTGVEIYHTNVMMCVGEGFTVICLESITDLREREKVKTELEKAGHQIVEISFSQMTSFAGNMLCLKNQKDKNILVMSQSAYDSLTPEQMKRLSVFCELLPIRIHTIETIGGGSARCMIAELNLQEL